MQVWPDPKLRREYVAVLMAIQFRMGLQEAQELAT
jgi:hypothetical protein